MSPEHVRLAEANNNNKKWKKWGPYLTERQWGTVREDYSPDGNAWEHCTHDMARSKAYRWGEEGIGGLSDDHQLLCFSVALWNKKDAILKERLFGLTNREGNHGEDVKEYYYYLDNTPTHSYMKMLYKYPQQAFPYSQLIEENRKRGKKDLEFELMDTGIFEDNAYFDVFVEYAKADVEDILVRITVHNRGNSEVSLHVLPQIWFRNTWSWGYSNYKPLLSSAGNGVIEIVHEELGYLFLHAEDSPELLFCENETNTERLYNVKSENLHSYYKDGINNYIIHGASHAVNPANIGTKATASYQIHLEGQSAHTIRLRLCKSLMNQPFTKFDAIFEKRIAEADQFYDHIQSGLTGADAKNVQRQAFAGLLWSKQYYYFDIPQWLNGDPDQPAPPAQRKKGRNRDWVHVNNADIISMPDKWEYPWYAAWDLAFHCLPLAIIDSRFAKDQLLLLTKEWYMHPNGQLPAYEWNFSDVNPPVHAWATWRVYKIDQKIHHGRGDLPFLESVFHKLLLNFTWWVNRKDNNGNNIFQGGFLGLDNIGVFDRSAELPTGGYIEQADGTSWMAMYTLNMLRIALELAKQNRVYEDLATKFFEHFLYIAGAMANVGESDIDLWDEEDQFFYDLLHTPHNSHIKLKVRSMVGLIPLFAVEVLEDDVFNALPEFTERLKWFLIYRPDLANLISRWQEKGKGERHLLSLLRGSRMKKLLKRMLDEKEFLSHYGIRALSRYHAEHPYIFKANGSTFCVDYQPGESNTYMYGGNSNWRGPIWLPLNFLVIESLQKFYHYYGDDFKVEYPTGSGVFITLEQIAHELSQRLANIFLKDENGKRAVFGNDEKFQNDPHFSEYILFYEYFHGDTGRGAGASHQTGWTGLIAKFLQPRN